MSVEHIWPCTVFDVIFFLSGNPLKNVDILDTYHNILNQLDQNLGRWLWLHNVYFLPAINGPWGLQYI